MKNNPDMNLRARLAFCATRSPVLATCFLTSLLILAPGAGGFTAPVFAQTAIRQSGGTKFPIRITKSGSYILETNLVVSAAATDAIDVAVNDVTIDLNGFAIIGTGAGSGGKGVAGVGATIPSRTHVRNGYIEAFGTGVSLGSFASVENATTFTDGSGINCADDSRIVGSAANGNSFGISAGANSVISGSTANSNTGIGISAGDNSLVSGNTANDNINGDGISCTGIGCQFSGNTASGNGFNGLGCDDRCLFSSNAANSNKSYGISCETPANALITHNVLGGNTNGDINCGTSLGDNVCSGSKC